MEDEILQQPKRSREGSNSLAYVLLLFFVAAVVVGVVHIFTRQAPVKAQAQAPPFGKLFESFSKSVEESDEDGIAVIRVFGPISLQDEESFPGITSSKGGASVASRIRDYKDNDRVKALVLHVNSPGGTVGASHEIHTALKEFQAAGKKVVVSMGDMAASGGYYIAAGADLIIANPGTLTGSIGVFVGNLNLVGLGEKIGVGMNVIKSGKHKDILSSWRELTPEERELLQSTVDNIYDQFLTLVSEGRKVDKDTLRKVCDGRIFSGEQAKELKLVDELGTYHDALLRATELAGLKGEPNIIDGSDDPFKELMRLLKIRISGEKEQTTLQGMLTGRPAALSNMPITLYYPGFGN